MKFDRKGLMLVLSSPSGAGKTSLCKKIISSDKDIILSVSSTTRRKRQSEIEGKDYFFSNEKEFLKQKEKNVFIETAKVFGFHYGTPKKFVENNLNEGKDILFDIDWQGTQKLSDYSISDLVSIFILPPSTDELKKRLKRRAEDSDEIVENRMSKARSEISHWVEYDYVLINEDINKCLEKILVIIEAERSKRSRQKYIFDFVEKLI